MCIHLLSCTKRGIYYQSTTYTMPSQILLYEWGRVFLTIAWSNSRPLFKALKSTGQEFIIAGAHEEVRVYCVENKTKRDKGSSVRPDSVQYSTCTTHELLYFSLDFSHVFNRIARRVTVATRNCIKSGRNYMHDRIYTPKLYTSKHIIMTGS
jgi:hypothetical protein